MAMIKDRLYDDSRLQQLASRYPAVFAEEAARVLKIISARLESDVVRNTPRGVGGAAGLAGSIFGEVQTIGQVVKSVVGTPSPYGEVVELGRRPGKFPPVAPIRMWVERKLGIGGEDGDQVAHAIAWKIYHKGFDGAHMFAEAWKQDHAWASDMIRTIPSRIARRLSQGAGD